MTIVFETASFTNFIRLDFRTDVSDLLENYLAAERVKKQGYLKVKNNNYFWRTYDQQELDLLEEKVNILSGFEFKWSESKNVKIPAAFAKEYIKATFKVVNKINYLDFIT